MLILGLDLETTWTEPVDPKLARPTEIGAVLYCTEDWKPLVTYNTLVFDESYPPSPPELVDLTGITDQMLKDHGILPKEAMDDLNILLEKAEYVAAHNGNEFDRVIYEEECLRQGMKAVDRPWIDSKTDLPYPGFIKTRKLTHLAADHGFANPFSHRALFDVLTMFKVMENYEFEEIINLSKEPNVTVAANVSYEDRDLAKKRGYYWDGEKKKWKKVLKQSQLKKEEEEAPFRIIQLTTD